MASTEIEFQPSKAKRTGIAGKMDSTKRYFWNPEEKTFMGRTASSWGWILLFYLVYYGCLAGFFALFLNVFFVTMDETVPSQTDMNSLIKGNPGMGFRPMVDVERTLIKFNQGDKDSYEKYVSLIESYVSQYENRTNEGVDCSNGKPDDMDEKTEYCALNTTEMAGYPCTAEDSYGYHEATPCVLLKLNKVFGWEPELYNNESIAEENEDAAAYFQPGYLTVMCEGENPADTDNMGDVVFYPNGGFPATGFPFNNQPGYLPPYVFAWFKNVKSGVLLQISCKAFASNIYHHKNDRAGSVHFELLID